MPAFVLTCWVKVLRHQLFLLSNTSRLQRWDAGRQGRCAYLLVLKQRGQLRPQRVREPPFPLGLLLKQVLDFHKRESPLLGSA